MRHLSTLLLCAVMALTTVAAGARGQESGAPKGRLNLMIEKLAQGLPVVTGADWMWIEKEHAAYDVKEIARDMAVLQTLRNARHQMLYPPVVRIPMEGDQEFRWAVKQVLEAGVFGIIFPHIENREQATKAVAAMRYPQKRVSKYQNPRGMRGHSCGAACSDAVWGIPFVDYQDRADVWPLNPDGELLAIMLVESGEGVKNIDQIVSTPGVGAIFVGPGDLSMDIGLGTRLIPGKDDNFPETEAMAQTVLKACKAKNVPCGTVADNEPELQRLIKDGWKVMLASFRARAR